MNGDFLPIFKKFILATALFCVLFLLLFTADFLTAPVNSKGLQEAAGKVLETAGPAKAVIGEAVQFDNAGPVFQQAFHVRERTGKKGIVFIVRMTGHSGPVPGVFYYTAAAGVVFKGIAGSVEYTNTPLRYGINAQVILRWQEKIGAAIESAGEVL